MEGENQRRKDHPGKAFHMHPLSLLSKDPFDLHKHVRISHLLKKIKNALDIGSL